MKQVIVRASFALALSVVTLLAGCAGPNRYPDFKSGGSDAPLTLLRQWTLPTRPDKPEDREAGDRGTEYSNAVLFENTVIFGNRTQGLVSFYPGIMQTRWVLPLDKGVQSELLISLSRSTSGMGASSATIYFGAGDGFLYAVSADTGRVIWRYELRNTLISKPVLNGGRLYVTTADDVVYALDAGTGKWLWHYRRRSAANATIHGASTPLVDDNEVIVGLSDGFLVALNAQDGALKWEKKLHQGNKFTDVDAHPVLNQGVLYVPSYDGALYAIRRKGGDILWRFDAGGSKQVVVDEDKLYLPSSDGTLYVLKSENAKVLWKFEMDGGTPTQVSLTPGHVILGSSYQYLYLLSKSDGKLMDRFNVGYGSGFAGAPLVDTIREDRTQGDIAKGPGITRFYILSQGGNLMAFQIYQDPERVRPRGRTHPYIF